MFIERSNKIHNYFYNYDKVVYINNCTKVVITCPIHGDFLQSPDAHLTGKKCSKCSNAANGDFHRNTLEYVIESAKKVHGDLYDYSLVKYTRDNVKVDIICKKHGIFRQTPNGHLCGHGCPKCKRSIGEEHIEKYLLSNNIPYKTQFKEHNCVAKRRLSFDFAIFKDFNYKDLLCLIEFDGIQHHRVIDYYGGAKAFEYTQEHDRIKNEYCLTNNIKLCRIAYHQMSEIPEILNKELQIEG